MFLSYSSAIFALYIKDFNLKHTSFEPVHSEVCLQDIDYLFNCGFIINRVNNTNNMSVQNKKKIKQWYHIYYSYFESIIDLLSKEYKNFDAHILWNAQEAIWIAITYLKMRQKTDGDCAFLW